MRTFALLGLAAFASAQVLSVDEINDVPAAPEVDVPAGAGSQTVPYNPKAAAASAYADAYNDHGPSARLARSVTKRTDVQCTALPVGAGPVPQPDTFQAFLADTDFSNAAYAAQTPSGWIRTYQNEKCSSSTSGYMGYSSYQTYDPATCAADCAGKAGCLSFNIFYERAPSINPGPDCADPASTTLIKCSFWGNTIEKPTCTNDGQFREKFHVVIAGSNGYRIAAPTYTVPKYTGVYLDTKTINAPTNCKSYMTVKTFNDGVFDPLRCAAACAAETAYNNKYRQNEGTCQFFTTYLLLKNGVTRFQACALYRSSWDASYATNSGYSSGSDKYTIQYSYAYTNGTNPGTDACKV